MQIDTKSVQVSGVYGSVQGPAWQTKTAAIDPKMLENAVNITDKLEIRKPTWEEIWDPAVTETVNEDGSVTKTIAGSRSWTMWQNGLCSYGKDAFKVSLTFDAETYQVGDLTEAADILAAAHAAQRVVVENDFSDLDLELPAPPRQLEVIYEGRKDKAANSFTEMVSGGQPEEREKVYQSVKAVFASFDAKYQSVTAQVSPESWLKASWFDSVMSLRRLGVSVKPETGNVAGLYSLQELEMSARKLCGGFSIKG